MEYSSKEQGLLNLMNRTNFKNLSKGDLKGITSKIGKLRPEVALKILDQFPEFIKIIQSSIPELKAILDKVIDSDDNSIDRAYDVFDKGLEASSKSRTELYSYANDLRTDLNRYYEHPEMSEDEADKLFEKQMELFKFVNEKDTEIAERENEIINKTGEKDSEKRRYNWEIVKGVSLSLVIIIGMGASFLGNDFELTDKFKV